MKNKTKWIVGIIVILLIVVGISGLDKEGEDIAAAAPIKIGVITPLTGGVAYWGESSILGVELAKRDLAAEGINVEFIVEDGQLDPTVALSAAQKLVNVDGVDAVYSEFNPAAIAVSSFLKDKDVFHLYDAAVVSPLAESRYTYKTYLDYEKSCKEVSELLKSRGVEKVGVLKVNLEFGDLCLSGIESVFSDVVTEGYNAGETDFKTSLTKLKSSNVEAVINVSFQPETLSSLRGIDELDMDVVFVGLSEIVTPDIVSQYSDSLEGSVLFGLPRVSEEFTQKLNNEFPEASISNYQALALSYIHLKQIANAFDSCGKDLDCVSKKMDNSSNEEVFGFVGFENHIAGFDVLIEEWKEGRFVEIK